MRNKVYMALIMIVVLSVAGCGKKEETVSSAPQMVSSVSTEVSSVAETSDESETDTEVAVETAGDETGVYPNSIGITDVPMGITEDICTVKVPLNYVLAGCYYDESGTLQTMEGLNSATTQVEESIAAGAFTGDHSMGSFTLTSLDAKPTKIDAMMYVKSVATLEDFKEMYPDGKEIGDTSVPGYVYRMEGLSGDELLTVGVQINADVMLQLMYDGPVVDEVGEDEAAQRIYNLITVK